MSKVRRKKLSKKGTKVLQLFTEQSLTKGPQGKSTFFVNKLVKNLETLDLQSAMFALVAGLAEGGESKRLTDVIEYVLKSISKKGIKNLLEVLTK